MSTSTSLNLRALLKSAVVRCRMDEPAALVSGLTASAKAFHVAAAAQARPHAVILYVVPTDGELEQAAGDARFFLAALEGLSDNAAERAVLPFPSHEVDPYRGMTPHIGVTTARARALHAIARGDARVVVASAAALLPRVSSPEAILAAAIDLKPGHDAPPEILAALLVDAGFTREDPVDQPGEFTIRGGIVDIYPPFEPQPVRIELVGDAIESMRRYDPATQRSTTAIDRLTVVPLRDAIARPKPRAAEQEPQSTDRSATVLDYLTRAREARLIVSERDEVDANASKLLAQLEQSYAQATGEGQADESNHDLTEADWDELSVGDDDEADLAVERAEIRTGRSGKAGRRKAGRAGPKVSTTRDLPAPGELFASWDDVAARLDTATNLVQLGVEEGIHVRCQPTIERRGRIADWVADIKQYRDAAPKAGATDAAARLTSEGTTLFVAAAAGRAERTLELLKEYDVFAVPVDRAEDAQYAAVLVAVGGLSRGFRLPDAALQIFAESDVFEEERRAPERRRTAAKAFLSDLRDLKVGDYVVHVDHGIGAFVGLKQIGIAPSTSSGQAESVQEFLELRYAADDKLFVPVERLDLVQKYSGATRPPLDRLGGTSWERAKTKVRKAMRDMAEELLKLYAARKAVPGHAFSPDSHWQLEFDDAFEYELTPDQQAAIADIKKDMESPTPMDRLLCGDVGYGKTEVAMRAAFKAVMDAKQVAFLAPTTVLAFQHQKTLRERFAGFPVRIESVSRFRTKGEAKEVLADLAAGKVDIIVGTHRLLSKDVHFRDLGLLVVDEEQRFGVAHKEKIKQLRKKVDVLTMTATPIPRTLNMSLVGIRDMSIIETPPKDRLSIQTNVVKFDQEVIRRAIRAELERGGQIYVVHNRVESIHSIAHLIQRLVPEARLVVGHGQMSDEALERAMLDFVARKHDVLIATTIVENGLDIPNANTIVINRADRYGLAQLYQLRGRVGRSDRPAYAYLLIPPEDNLSPVAKKRLAAIKEFSDLGSGFRVAALDLEIRGAGNLLGGEQSGQMETVGFEMYMKLLEQTVRELKGEELEDEHRANVNLRVDVRIDEGYVPDMNQRLMLYRKVAAARHEDEIDKVLDEMIDRYGPLPGSVLNLADYGRIRVMADRLGIETIDREGATVVIKFGAGTRVDPTRLVNMVRERPELTLIPPSGLRLTLGELIRDSGMRKDRKPSPQSAIADPRRRASRYQGTAPSWWTARAHEAEIGPGFSKAEILKPKPDDPRAPGGVFERVGGLLSDLLD